jgi:hypothetical protein
MAKHPLLKNANDDFADSVAVEDASWREFMDAGGVYPKEADPPTMPGSLDDVKLSEASIAEAEFNNIVFGNTTVTSLSTAYDNLRDNDLRK